MASKIYDANRFFEQGDYYKSIQYYNEVKTNKSLEFIADFNIKLINSRLRRDVIQLSEQMNLFDHKWYCSQFENPGLEVNFIHYLTEGIYENLTPINLALQKDQTYVLNIKVSVIMPVFNRSAVVCDAIDSVLTQNLRAFELIIVDDASKDDTVLVIKNKYFEYINSGFIKLIESKQNGGHSRARNIALNVASGNVIAYLDSDNVWRDYHLYYTIKAYLAIGGGNNLVYSAIEVNNKDSNTRSILFKLYNRYDFLRQNHIDLNSVVHGIGLYHELSGFDENMTRLVDWDLLIKYTRLVIPVAVPIVTVDYFINTSQLNNVSTTASIQDNFEKIIIKNIHEYENKKIISDKKLYELRSHHSKNIMTLSKDAKFFSDRNVTLYVICSSIDDVNCLQIDEIGCNIQYIIYDNDNKSMIVNITKEIITFADMDHGVIWWPDVHQNMLAVDLLRSLVLSLSYENVDIALLSYSLDFSDSIYLNCLRNQCMFTSNVAQHFFNTFDLRSINLVGKVICSANIYDSTTHSIKLDKLFGRSKIDVKHKYFITNSDSDCESPKFKDTNKTLLHNKVKPVVFVFPLKLAVGGVERNTIEVMQVLQEYYDFIYITLEKVTSQQGSLAHQIMEVATLIDLAEITNYDNYLDYFQVLKDIYQPSVLWVCNGSMWLCNNTINIRKIFFDIPIIDQQCYDETEGWIRRYKEDGVQSFDKFIAINSRILNRFINDFHMDEANVHLIYSVLNGQKFLDFKQNMPHEDTTLNKFNLPKNKKLFIYMGRLVEQKRPMDFLNLAKLRKSNLDEFFVLIGNGVLANQVQDFIVAESLPNLIWIEFVENTAEIWSVATAMVITSAFEGLPIAMLEALSMGVPVISTDVGDIKIVLDKYNAGTVVEKIGDLNCWCDSFEKFKHQLEMLSTNIQYHSNAVIEQFSSTNIAVQYQNCWNEAINLYKTRRLAC